MSHVKSAMKAQPQQLRAVARGTRKVAAPVAATAAHAVRKHGKSRPITTLLVVAILVMVGTSLAAQYWQQLALLVVLVVAVVVALSLLVSVARSLLGSRVDSGP